MSRRLIAALALCIAAPLATAQDYPTKPIKLIVPFPPAGGTDIMSRVVAQKLTEANKWTVIVDNKPGAGGNIGVDAAAKAQPDGYTLVMGQTSNLAINPTLYASLPYDPLKDLEPVVLVGEGPIALAVRAESPLKTIADLVAAAKAKPGSITMATPGNGTVSHLAGVRLMQTAGVKFEHIPYKGAAAALPDLMSGTVDFYAASVPSVQGQVASGRLRLLAVTSKRRSPIFPNVPTVGETYKGFEAVTWFGILAPRGTPPSIVAKLNSEINKALKSPNVRATFAAQGVEPLIMTPNELGAFVKTEIAKWTKSVKDSGAKAE